MFPDTDINKDYRAIQYVENGGNSTKRDIKTGRTTLSKIITEPSDRLWVLIILILAGYSLLLTFFCLKKGITTVFMHIYYIPVVLIAYRYRKTGIILSAIFGLMYVAMVAYFTGFDIKQILLAFERLIIFIFVAAVIAWLSDRLENSRIFFETLAEISPVGIIRTDKKGICSYVNKKFTEILGISKEQALGKEISKFVYVEDQNKFLSECSEITEKNSKIGHEYSFQKSDGKTAWVLFQAGLEKDIDGNTTGYIATITDLSRIKTAEMFKRTQFAFDHSPDDIYFANRKGEIVYANISARNSFGIFSNDNKECKSVFDIDPNMTKNRWEELWSIITKKDFFKFESTHRREDGSNYPVEISQYYLTYDNEEYSCAIARDIADRKKFETALKESEEKYRLLAEASLDPIYIIGLDDTIQYVNNRAAELLNENADNIIGKSRKNYFPQDIAEGQEKSLRKVIETGEPLLIEKRVTYKGHEYWQDHSLVPLKNENGEVYAILGVSHDITDLKNAEKSLKEVNKKLNLLSNITRHDILNQITGAAGYLELIDLDREIPHGTNAEKYLKNISKSIDIIKHQIQFTAHYKNLGEEEPDWFNVGDIIDETYSNYSFDGFKLINNVKNVEVLADPLFEKVIYTLFDNAFKHGEKIAQIIFGAEETDEGLIITCEDDGVGIPDKAKEKIFNREYYKNSGLGLFLSKGILAITGLKIKETGVFGKGTRFEIHIPKDKYRFTDSG